MSSKMNRQAFVGVVDDLAGMVENAMVPSLFRSNIVQILKESVDHYYPPDGPCWKDKPDCVGFWLFLHVSGRFKGEAFAREFDDDDLDGFTGRKELRYFGPIPAPLPTVEGEDHNV